MATIRDGAVIFKRMDENHFRVKVIGVKNNRRYEMSIQNGVNLFKLDIGDTLEIGLDPCDKEKSWLRKAFGHI